MSKAKAAPQKKLTPFVYKKKKPSPAAASDNANLGQALAAENAKLKEQVGSLTERLDVIEAASGSDPAAKNEA